MALILFLYFILALLQENNGAWYETETKLKRKLLEQYDFDVIPLVKFKQALNVAVGLSLVSIDDFSWNDDRLKWDPSEYDNITKSYSFKHQDVWTPDIVLYFGDQEITYDIAKGPYTIVTNNGDVIFVPPTKINMKCSSRFDISNQDSQLKEEILDIDKHESHDLTRWCSFTFGSWVFDASMLQISLMDKDKKIDLSSYIPDSKRPWEIVSNFVTVGNKTYPCCPDYPYMYATFTLKLRKIFS